MGLRPVSPNAAAVVTDESGPDGDDNLAHEARETANRMAAVLPDDLRQGFERAEPVRRLAEIRT